MTLVIRTWLTTRSDSVERRGSPCRYKNCGYSTVDELRTELKRRWKENYYVVDIPNGVEITPKPHHLPYVYHGKQQVTLEN